MKFYKSNGFLKSLSSTGAISISACILIALGAISWFALSRNDNTVKPAPNNSSQSYKEPESSYNNDNVTSENSTPDQDVNQSVSDVPYTNESVPETPSPEPIKFVIPVSGQILKGYSDTALQYSATYNDMRLHTGIDIACAGGSEIKSASSGTVKSIVDDAAYGKVITIDHTGELTVKYCGFKEVKVKEGDNLNAGDVIGLSGEIPAECADKPHIHIEAFLQKKPISPIDALKLK